MYATMSQAHARGLEAAERGADNTELFDANFRAKALAFIVAHIEKHGRVSGESTTLAAVLAGIRPRDDRHFGAVYQKALRDKRIHVVGHCPACVAMAAAAGRCTRLARRRPTASPIDLTNNEEDTQ